MSASLVIGRGWLGTAVAAALSGLGAVRTIDIDTEPWLVGRDPAADRELAALLERHSVDIVVNAAGRLGGTPDELDAANADFPAWLAGALRRASDLRAVRLVHIGSASEYGDPGTSDPIGESAPALAAGAYATSKLRGTSAVLDARAAGLDATVAHVFNPVGPGVRPDSPLGEWLTAVADLPPSGGTVTVFEADTRRDFVALDDVAEAIAGLAGTAESAPIVNVCSGVGVRYGDIAAAMMKAAGKEGSVMSLDRGGIMAVVGDNRLLGELTGRRPTMSLARLVQITTL